MIDHETIAGLRRLASDPEAPAMLVAWEALAALPALLDRIEELEAATVERVARYLERQTGCLSGRDLANHVRREFSSE